MAVHRAETGADATATRWEAAVLCGGASSRLSAGGDAGGSIDKAGIVLGGVAMGVRVGAVAQAAGAVTVAGVGARREVADALAAHGMGVVDDAWPGEGPAGALVTALRHAAEPIVVVLGCDYPRLSPITMQRLVARLVVDPENAAVVAQAGGRLHPTVGAWRVSVCLPVGEAFIASGERSLRGLAGAVAAIPMPVATCEVTDIDTPDDLAGFRAAEAHAPATAPTGTIRGSHVPAGDASHDAEVSAP